jgi:hypothetical protein
MSTMQGVAAPEIGQLTEDDLDELREIISRLHEGNINPKEFEARRAVLIERYSRDLIVEATERFKEEADKESEAESEHFYRQVQSFSFPADANPKAFHGIAGEVTRLICEGTENKPEAVLAQFLCIVGNAIGRAPYKMQDKEHGANINVAIVGPTAGGAKGSSLDAVKRLFKSAYPNYCSTKFSGGHNSSEAILEEIRDEVKGKNENGEEVIQEEEVPDKRLLIIEEELTRVLNASQRGGCTISETCREFYDRPDEVRAKSRRSRLVSTKPHVSIIGHVTPEGLRHSLKSVEVFNGFANRFIFIASMRTMPVPRPPVVDWKKGRAAEIATHLLHVGKMFHPLTVSNNCPPIEFDFTYDAAKRWDEIYYRLEAEYTGKSGLHGAIVARWKPSILRLAIIYAALDMDTLPRKNEDDFCEGYAFAIDACHIEAAESLWRYAAESAVWAFGLNSGNPNADKVLQHLSRAGEKGSAKTTIRQECFNNHIATADLDEALSFLKNAGYARLQKKGRQETWFKV